jgi:DNA-binding SARP family transcriptional activator
MSDADASAKDVVEELRARARRHSRAGDQVTAITCLERALHAANDEDTSASLLIELASAEARINPVRAAARYRDALALIDDPVTRLEVAVRRARSLASAGMVVEALEQLDAAKREASDEQLTLEADLAYIALARQSLETRPLGRARLTRIQSARAGEHEGASPELLAELAYERVLAGDDRHRVISAAVAALGGEEMTRLHDLPPFSRHAAVLALAWSGELGAAERAATLLLARAQRRGSVIDAAAAHALLFNVEWRRGDVVQTAAHASPVLAAGGEGLAALLPGAVGIRSMTLALQGLGDEAVAALELPGNDRRWSSLPTYHGYLIGAASTHLLVGDFRQAHRLALQCGTAATSMGTANPGVLPWRELAAHAAVEMGQPAEAMDLALDAVEGARAFGEPRAIATALRALAAASEDEACVLLAEAQDLAERSGDRLTLAGIHIDLARALSRRNAIDDVQRHARAAMELAHTAGAVLLEKQAAAIEAPRQRASGAPDRPRATTTRGGHLRVLGQFSLTDADGRPCALAGVPSKAVRVLAAAGGPLHVEQLADHLWDDPADPARTRARLRNVIARTKCGDRPAIRREGDIVFLDPAIKVDAAQFEEACARALAASEEDALERAVAATLAYEGDLLPTDPYAEWAAIPRERLRLRYLTMCDRAARLAAAAGLSDLALDRLQAAIRHDPYDVDRYLQAATILAAIGDTAGAEAMRERERRVRTAFDA